MKWPDQPLVLRSCLIGLVLLGSASRHVVAQAPRGGPRLAAVAQPWSSADWGPSYQSGGERSAASIIVTHAAVGTGAGLLIGLVLSSASVDKDESSVVLTWTALGAAAGIVSGVVTYLVGQRE